MIRTGGNRNSRLGSKRKLPAELLEADPLQEVLPRADPVRLPLALLLQVALRQLNLRRRRLLLPNKQNLNRRLLCQISLKLLLSIGSSRG